MTDDVSLRELSTSFVFTDLHGLASIREGFGELLALAVGDLTKRFDWIWRRLDLYQSLLIV